MMTMVGLVVVKMPLCRTLRRIGVAIRYTGTQEQRRISDEVLRTLKSNEGSWRLVDGILSMSQDPNTKFYVRSAHSVSFIVFTSPT